MIVALLALAVLSGGASDKASTDGMSAGRNLYKVESQDDAPQEPELIVSEDYLRHETATENLIGIFQELGPEVLVLLNDQALSESERDVRLRALLVPYDADIAAFQTAHAQLIRSGLLLQGHSAADAEKQAREQTQIATAQMLSGFFMGAWSPIDDETPLEETPPNPG